MKYLSAFLSLLTASAFGLSTHAYVPDQTGSIVQIIDTTQDTVNTIFGFNNPRVVKVTSDGTQAIVGQDNGKLLVIDTLTRTLLPISLDVDPPVAMSITPNNEYVYVVCNNNTVVVVKIPEYIIETTIVGFDKPGDVKISLDGDHAYVTNTGNGTISVIRTLDNTVMDTIVGMDNPVGMTLTNDGAYGYVSDTKNNCIYVIQTSNNTLINKILGFNAPKYIAMSRDDNYFYVTSQGNNLVNKVRLSDSQFISSVIIPFPSSIATGLGGHYYLVGSSTGVVFKVRVLDDNIENVFPGTGNPSNIAVTLNNPPAISINGCQINTDPLNIYNRITWGDAPGSPLNYKLYSDSAYKHLIVSLSGATLEFEHMNLLEGQTYSYYLLAEYADGFSSTVGNLDVTPNRVCVGDM